MSGVDAELVGADVLERGDAAAERVVKAAKGAGAFQRQDVGRLLDDAEERRVAVGVGADFAERAGREEAAARAEADLRDGVGEGADDFLRAGVAVLHHPEGDALGAARADAGHALQLRDEVLERGGVFSAFHAGVDE